MIRGKLMVEFEIPDIAMDDFPRAVDVIGLWTSSGDDRGVIRLRERIMREEVLNHGADQVGGNLVVWERLAGITTVRSLGDAIRIVDDQALRTEIEIPLFHRRGG